MNRILYDYIKKQRGNGFSLTKIKSYLLEKNFKETDIDDCIRTLDRERRRILTIGAVVLIALIAVITIAMSVIEGPVTKFDSANIDTPKYIEKKNIEKEELVEMVEKKERIKDSFYVNDIITTDSSGKSTLSFNPGEDITMEFSAEDIKPLIFGSTYETAFRIELFLIGPDGSMDDSIKVDEVFMDFFADGERKTIEKDFTFRIGQDKRAGKYTVITTFTDIYNNEKTISSAEVIVE